LNFTKLSTLRIINNQYEDQTITLEVEQQKDGPPKKLIEKIHIKSGNRNKIISSHKKKQEESRVLPRYLMIQKRKRREVLLN